MANRFLSSYNRARLLLFLASALCYALFYLAAKTLDVPPFAGYAGSLVQSSPFTGFVLVIIGLIVGTLIGSLVAGVIRFDAGIVAATLGMTALSVRGGRMTTVLLSSTGPGIYLTLLVETLLLFGMVVAAWSLLWFLHRNGWLKADASRDGVQGIDDSLNQQLLALASHTVLMGFFLLVLCRADDKVQVIGAMAISAFLASVFTNMIFPVRPSIFFWLSPMVVGVIGYFLAYLDPEGWQIGTNINVFAALARPLPLDYASIGVASAVVGYWMARRWQRDSQASPAVATS